MAINARRKVFISYHHAGDQAYYNAFSSAFHDKYEVFYDNSLDRARDSEDETYILRYIRENHLTGSSCLIVLCGVDTWRRKYVDWEIKAALDQEMGVLAIQLPTLKPAVAGGNINVPGRLADNINSGYALFKHWDTATKSLQGLSDLIEASLTQSKRLIDNSRARRQKNG
ncbi:hypothetical protein ASD38_16770 [Caulobacter sp. Root487D2Y]|uniref:TIR domain-containing protein n=1 Tax=Caulobacter sp. Root487D2Y TaxID=1736547 RepID=UPI0007017D7F|nr:TIR domain-containing protein [Caulobacter sp. Root487D2Y]KQY27562.1 hypothetical protein ASD38_16770 [Caulobacter sp. Root487D2Y]